MGESLSIGRLYTLEVSFIWQGILIRGVDGLPEDDDTVRFLAETGLDRVGEVGDDGIKLLP